MSGGTVIRRVFGEKGRGRGCLAAGGTRRWGSPESGHAEREGSSSREATRLRCQLCVDFDARHAELSHYVERSHPIERLEVVESEAAERARGLLRESGDGDG